MNNLLNEALDDLSAILQDLLEAADDPDTSDSAHAVLHEAMSHLEEAQRSIEEAKEL